MRYGFLTYKNKLRESVTEKLLHVMDEKLLHNRLWTEIARPIVNTAMNARFAQSHHEDNKISG